MKVAAYIPLIVFLLLTVAFVVKIYDTSKSGNKTFFNESAMVGSDLPKFSLPSIKKGDLGLSYNNFKDKYSLINVFASWCVACLAEHPVLMKLKAKNILPIYGIAWKDKDTRTRQWLKQNGNPYSKVGGDKTGEVVISLGITGAPESFLVNKERKIIYHHVGPLDMDTINSNIIPLIQ